MFVGDLVRFSQSSTERVATTEASSAKGRLGLVRKLSRESAISAPSCLVVPLSRSGSAKVDDVWVKIADVEVELMGKPFQQPEIIPHFEEEANFSKLVFQASALRPLAPALKRRRCKICILGGSISLQKAGYRHHMVEALRRRGVEVEDVPAAVGTAGCKPLSLVVSEWVISKKPDLLLIEAAVNDGDDLLEHTPLADVLGLLRAAEGIVRTVRRRSPETCIAFLEMFLRDDAEGARLVKTGTGAWMHSDTRDAIGWYHDVAPRLHRHICRHYGLAQIDLIPAMRSLSSEVRDLWFRDDCHHTDLGGERLGLLVAKLLLWSVRQPQPQPPALQAQGPAPGKALVPALDAQPWCNGRTLRVATGWLTQPFTRMLEKDPLHLFEQAEWLLLGAGGAATIPFKGRACGLMTMLGPDAPTLLVRIDNMAPQRLALFDRWCYYWRDAVVLLAEGLEDTTHMLHLIVEEQPPERQVLRRQPEGGAAALWERFVSEAARLGRPGPQHLWLLYACVVEGDK